MPSCPSGDLIMESIRSQHKRRRSPSASRSAFTLVEMLVSVALVLLMMSMFAAIFGMATNSVANQRGIAENDQRARALVTILRNDFSNRTNRFPFPFHEGENSSTAPSPRASSNGYVYISTNNPDSGHDDRLQLTVSAMAQSAGIDKSPFFGVANILADRSPSAFATPTSLNINRNQPDADDGTMQPNRTAASSAAEVCYIWRNGNLYRRVSLIREPQRMAGQTLGPQPVTRTGVNYFAGYDDTTPTPNYDGRYAIGSVTNLSNNFLRDFDFSAIPTIDLSGNQSAQFIGLDSLGNGLTTVGAAADSLGTPGNRFGFNKLALSPGQCIREFDSALPIPRYFGLYLHAETSARNFNWPQMPATADAAAEDTGGLLGPTGNPYDPTTPILVDPTTGLVTQFSESVSGNGRGGVRRNEDLLMTNVHEFKVELWDDRLQRFVTPGHSFRDSANGEPGDYHVSRCHNLAYSPTSSGTVFDTFNPVGGAAGIAPYIAYKYYPPRLSDSLSGPSPDGMALPLSPSGNVPQYWASTSNYVVGDIVFARSFGIAGMPFLWGYMPPQGFQIAYRCVQAGPAIVGPSGEPQWPVNPGRRVQSAPGAAVFESLDNRRPLQSVRVTVRFQDRNSDKMRQTSIILSVNDHTK